MAVRWALPNALVEARRLGTDFLPVGEARIIEAELVADADAPEVRLAATVANWIAVSTDGGASFVPLGTDVQAGLDVGPLLRGARLPMLLRVVPQAPYRQRRIGLLIGGGV